LGAGLPTPPKGLTEGLPRLSQLLLIADRSIKDHLMPDAPSSASNLSLSLTSEERTCLLELLEHTLGETRVEAHRTHTPNYRDKVLHHEVVLKGLIEKLSKAHT
jgi:hypothetical protein